MNTKRSKNSNKIKNFGLAACAIMALGVMTAGEAAAQCRVGGGNAGYGYNSGYGVTGNSYNYGSNFNNRGNVGYNNGYGLTSGYRGYSTQRPSLSLGLSYNSNRNSRYGATYGNYGSGIRQSQLNHGNGLYNSSRQPAAYRHGNHIDVEDGYGRQHLRSRGF
ncbi:MAG: hypothetical protein ABJZ55_10855 [Fuerstiella sp.]